jgi:large subunit ribosomal protein L35Ae
MSKVSGRIVNYRIGPKTQKSNECIIQFENFDSASKAGQLVGRKITWRNGKRRFTGRIVALHGRNGAVRARFNPGLPGQALGTTVELLE